MRSFLLAAVAAAAVLPAAAQAQTDPTPFTGLRAEDEVVPSFREGVDAMSFGWKDKIAPRLGAAYDVRGDGKFKIYGSWGRYYDWTKYELPRGSYGGDLWQIYYRALDTLDLGSLNLSNTVAVQAIC